LTEVLDVAKKDGRWTECPACKEIIITKRLEKNLLVCPHCDFHFRLGGKERIALTCDDKGFVELDLATSSAETRAKKLEKDFKGGMATIKGQTCVLGVMDFSVKGGSMGVDMAQNIITLMQHAHKTARPLVMFCASGGVRVQEGIWGLLQMIRTVHARNTTANIPMITVFTDPTLGGVTASFSALADIILAEPGCRIGFAGPRVIEYTINYPLLPPDFQDASRLLSNGFLDRIVHRHQLRDTLSYLLQWF